MNIIVLLNISTPVPPHKVTQILPLPQLPTSLLKLTYPTTTSVDNDIPFPLVRHPHTYFLSIPALPPLSAHRIDYIPSPAGLARSLI